MLESVTIEKHDVVQSRKMLRRRLTLSDTDRNTASPTESAVWKRGWREHSGAGRLKKRIPGIAFGAGAACFVRDCGKSGAEGRLE